MPAPLKTTQTSRSQGVTVLTVGTQFEMIEEMNLQPVSDAILAAARDSDPPRLVVDLSHVKFFGSSFIETLFRAHHRMNERDGGRFAISGLQPYCREVIEITHLDRLWSLFDTTDNAVNSLCEQTADGAASHA